MTIPTAKEIYERHIRPLPVQERLQLLAMVAQDLVTQATPPTQDLHSIMELQGLGKEIWTGVDAGEYVDSLRQEWNHRPG